MSGYDKHQNRARENLHLDISMKDMEKGRKAESKYFYKKQEAEHKMYKDRLNSGSKTKAVKTAALDNAKHGDIEKHIRNPNKTMLSKLSSSNQKRTKK